MGANFVFFIAGFSICFICFFSLSFFDNLRKEREERSGVKECEEQFFDKLSSTSDFLLFCSKSNDNVVFVPLNATLELASSGVKSTLCGHACEVVAKKEDFVSEPFLLEHNLVNHIKRGCMPAISWP